MGERSERSERHREFGSDIKKSPESDGPAGRRGASHPDVRHPAPARRGKLGALAGLGAERRGGARGAGDGWGAGGVRAGAPALLADGEGELAAAPGRLL